MIIYPVYHLIFFFGNLIQSGILFRGKTPSEALSEFKQRFGNVFQFWLGPSRLIVVSGANDVQHIFTHRHIYDQGYTFEKFTALIPNSLIGIKGQLTFNN